MSGFQLASLILIGLGLSANAETAPPATPLPSQAKPIQGVVMPVPKEIFRTLDQFHDSNWRAVQRPEIAQWRSHGDQAQIAVLLGVVIGEGFIAMEAQDAPEVKRLGSSVLKLARGLGVEETALRRSKSIIEFTDRGNWAAARQEWDGVLSDLEAGMVRLKSGQLAELVSVGGWLRGTEALSALVLQNYSTDRAELLRQPVLAESLEKQLLGLSGKMRRNGLVKELQGGTRKIHDLIPNDNQPLPEVTVRQIHDLCSGLVRASSRRPA